MSSSGVWVLFFSAVHSLTFLLIGKQKEEKKVSSLMVQTGKTES